MDILSLKSRYMYALTGIQSLNPRFLQKYAGVTIITLFLFFS